MQIDEWRKLPLWFKIVQFNLKTKNHVKKAKIDEEIFFSNEDSTKWRKHAYSFSFGDTTFTQVFNFNFQVHLKSKIPLILESEKYSDIKYTDSLLNTAQLIKPVINFKKVGETIASLPLYQFHTGDLMLIKSFKPRAKHPLKLYKEVSKKFNLNNRRFNYWQSRVGIFYLPTIDEPYPGTMLSADVEKVYIYFDDFLGLVGTSFNINGFEFTCLRKNLYKDWRPF